LSFYYRKQLILSSAVASSDRIVDKAYEVAEIGKWLDFVNLLSYDFYGPWNNFTFHHTPMNGSEYTIPDSLKLWMDRGMPAEKIVFGFSTYGRSWTLTDPWEFGLYVDADGPGVKGQYSGLAGMLSYYEVCSQHWTRKVDNNIALAPYVFKGDQWVSYDDQKSIRYKMQESVIKYNLKGFMVWTLDFDDFKGAFCKQGRYPLISVMKEILVDHENRLNAGLLPPTTTQKTTITIPTTTTPTTTTTTPTTTTTTTTTTNYNNDHSNYNNDHTNYNNDHPNHNNKKTRAGSDY